MKREAKKYYKAVYKKGDDIYCLDEIFKYSKEFKGATGTIFNIITDEEIKERMDNYDYDERWKMAVSGDITEMSLIDYEEELKETEGDNLVIDEPYENYGIELKENEKLDIIGGGRCFDPDRMKGDDIEILDLELFNKIIDIEK